MLENNIYARKNFSAHITDALSSGYQSILQYHTVKLMNRLLFLFAGMFAMLVIAAACSIDHVSWTRVQPPGTPVV
jgi:hypothetical protein